MFEIIKQGTKFDFLGRAKIYFIVSALLIIGSLFLIFTKGFNYGVDFSGGTVVQVKFEKAPDIEVMRNTLNNAVVGDVSIQNFGDENDFIIRAEQTSGDLQVVADSIQNTLIENFKDLGNITIERVEQVGPQVGKDLKNKAVLAVIYAVVGILIYIAIRFQFIYGIGAIIALIHDIILTLAIIIIANVSFDLTVLASVLTVVGYSLNDKIVVFDRIRENVKAMPDTSLMQVMNKSINETLSRTILTSTSTLLALLALLVFGGEVIYGFSLAMIAGILIGTYSSIGIASSSVYYMQQFASKKKSKK